LYDPTNAELAQATGSPVHPERMDFDLVIVGGGPAGLSAAVYGASEGFSTLVIDGGGVGGQATSSSLIRNYLGFPRGVSGRRLAQEAYQQAGVFGASFSFMQRVTDVRRVDGELAVQLSDSVWVRARAVLLATGASYRRLGVPALEALNGYGVLYGAPASEAPRIAGRDVYIVGGANSAGQAAVYLARGARSVTLLVRGRSLESSMSYYLIQQINEAENISVRTGSVVEAAHGSDHLEQLTLRDTESGNTELVDAQWMFVFIGAAPLTDWLDGAVLRDERGFILAGPDLSADGKPPASWELDRAPYHLETNIPGVFVAGDARAESAKRVASAVGEGAMAVMLVHRYLEQS
jgi:thioredoxin reductase (NADPH)